MAEDVTVAVTQTGEVEVTVDTDAATITLGTVTTGAAGSSAIITNSGTSSAAVFNFTIPRGATGSPGPNSVTSTTTSDGTATLSLSTLTLGSAATFNATTYTFGTGAASALKTALAISSADVADAVTIGVTAAAGKLLKLNASGDFTFTQGTREVYVGSDGVSIESPAQFANLSIGGLATDGDVTCDTLTSETSIDCVGEIRNSGLSGFFTTRNSYRFFDPVTGNVGALQFASISAARFYTVPNKTGTFAFLDDITVTDTNTVTLTNKTLTNPTVTDFTESTVAIGNSGTSQTIALTSGTFQTVTLTGNCTFTMPTATAGKSFILKVMTGAGGFTATFTGVKWSGSTAPTITTTSSRYDLISFIADGTAWSGSIIQNFT